MMFMRNNIVGIKICTTMLMALTVVMAGGCSMLDKIENADVQYWINLKTDGSLTAKKWPG